MQEKNVPERKPSEAGLPETGKPETGKKGGQTDVGKKRGDMGEHKPGVGGDVGHTDEVGKQGA